MAKKARIIPLEDPPSVSSSDEDELDSESESESKEPEASPIEGSGKAIALKTVGHSSAMKRRKSEGTSTEAVTKKAKMTGTWTSLFKRLWSEDDETTVLQRLIDFNADKGTNPFEDKTGFYEFVKREVTCEVSKYQLVEKIRTLKRKYIGTSKKRVDRSFSKPHEKNCSRLAKYIWGPDGTLLLTSKNALQDGNQVFTHSSSDKEVVEDDDDDDDKEVFSLSSGDSGQDKVVGEGEGVKEDFTPNGQDEVMAHVGEGSGKMAVAEDEVLAHGGQGSGKKLVEEDYVLGHGGGGSSKKIVEAEVLARGGASSSKKVVVEEVNDELARGGGRSSKKVVVEENEDLARGGGSSRKKVVEEGNEDLARGGGNSESLGVRRDPDWFEKSVLVQSIASYGVADHTIKERWSMFSEETKKKLEEEWKLLESKQLHVASLMIKYTSELACKFGEAI